MRRWSHDEEVPEVLPRGHRTRGTDGVRGQGPVRVAVGGHRIDCSQDRLHGRDPPPLVCQHERDTGQREGTTTAEAQRVKELEREVRELRKANEILKLASAFFAQAELDRRLK